MRLKDLTIEVDGIALKGRAYLPALEPEGEDWKKEPLLILCHGIPRGEPSPDEKERGQEEEPVVDGGYPALAERCFDEGFPCFHFNFRGTGESGGNFNLKGWTRDLWGVLDHWEQKELLQGGFYLWGFSAGAAVSCCVAAVDPRIRGVVLAASPAEFRSLFPRKNLQAILERFRETGIIRDSSFPADPESWLEDIYSVNPLEEIHKIAPRPLLLVHGTGDDVVPYEHAQKLNEAVEANRKAGTGARQAPAGEPEPLLTLPGAGHQLRKDPQAVAKCINWLKELGK
jgi:pimeloyl-ACP methyl ester carboxylesterase